MLLKTKNIYLKTLIIPITGILFIVFLIIFSKTAVTSALKAIDLWLGIVFPSLFPFLVASEILNGTSFVKAVGVFFEPVMRPLFNLPGCASYPFALGITSGYPVGAKATAKMRKDKLLTKREGERLLAFCNNSSPLFITGAVAVGMLKMPYLGPFLLICHIVSSVSTGLLFGFFDRREIIKIKIIRPKAKGKGIGKKSVLKKFLEELLGKNNNIKADGVNTGNDIGTILGNAVVNSMATMLAIGGFIILFSVIINLLLESGALKIISSIFSTFFFLRKNPDLSKDIIAPSISGFIEITTGLKQVCSLENIPLTLKLVLTSIIMGWGGLSVHFQVLSVTRDTDLSIKPYLLGKFIQSIFAALYTYIGLKITNCIPEISNEVFYTVQSIKTVAWQQYLVSSCRYLLVFLSSLLALTILTAPLRHPLKHKKKTNLRN
ncbi:MAG: sporulation integral membrane protein YlbJ [Firmicutes bacterium]|nr:sporulation integral membrane protein YlbJ [Bacillota bacterium]